MARLLSVYPKAVLDGNTWRLFVKVSDDSTDVRNETGTTHEYTARANTPIRGSLSLLKVVFAVEVPDGTTNQAVEDAFATDTVRGVESTWSEWRATGEDVITRLGGAPSQKEFWEGCSKTETKQTRDDTDTFTVQRGWSVKRIHQHEGDNTNLDEEREIRPRGGRRG